MNNKLIGLVVALSTYAMSASADDVHHHILADTSPERMRMALPFSDGVQVGATLYVSGQLGIDPENGKIAADVAREARLAMEHLKVTLGAAGMRMSDLVSVQIYCTDMHLYDTFDSIYRSYFSRSYFSGDYPARAFVGVHELALGAHFEVIAVAVRDPRDKR
jgi:2-iminobutanoate/2-iminopropanoate deaminase